MRVSPNRNQRSRRRSRMRPDAVRSESYRPFLEPPHCHDPSAVCLVSSLPPSVMANIPFEVQTVLWDLQESACVAYASYERLQDLVDDRFERLMPHIGADGLTFSESSWFNYDNQRKAEKGYLVSEAIPDLLHKVSQMRPALQPFLSLSLSTETSPRRISVETWWNDVQNSVADWVRVAQKVDLPRFEETVEDYLAGRHEEGRCDTEEPSPLQTPTSSDDLPVPSIRLPVNMDEKAKEAEAISSVLSVKEANVTIKPLAYSTDSGISMVVA